MDSNTHSTGPADRRPAESLDGLTDSPVGLTGLAALVAELNELAAHDPSRLADQVRAERVLVLRRLVDRLEGHWLSELAAVDASAAAGADEGVQAPSTASWLRARLRMGAGAAAGAVRTARALFRGPLTATAQALVDGELTAAHAGVLAHGTQDLAAHLTAEAEPVLVEAARRLDPPRLRRVVAHLCVVADPDSERDRAERRHQRRGVWLAPTWEGMVALNGLLEPEAGQTLLAALEPLARPTTAEDTRSGGQRNADALTELARRALEGGRLPQTGGVRPQLTVTVDLDSLLGRPGAVGGELGWAGPLDPEGCQRLACDGALTRVLVTRHSPGQNGHHRTGPPGVTYRPNGDELPEAQDPGGAEGLPAANHTGEDLATWLRAAMGLLPPALGGALSQPLDVGRTTRVVQPAQRSALVVRDGGCVFPDCDRPPGWCEAHHLVHWLHGGPTDLANLALLCRAHHRAVHEGGWRLIRDPDGWLTATPPHRQRRRHHAAA
jgi:Domain of unknown function (DUF222)/HNH endonuclease